MYHGQADDAASHASSTHSAALQPVAQATTASSAEVERPSEANGTGGDHQPGMLLLRDYMGFISP